MNEEEEEPTSIKLSKVLESEGLLDLALRAAAGEFDDFKSEHVSPIHVLVEELIVKGRPDLARRAIDGEWDGTLTESRAWFDKYIKGEG